jgi:hypothetical protein
MKKFILSALLVLFSLVAFSQSRLGYTPQQILSEFPPTIYNTVTGYDNDGDYFIQVRFDRCYARYYFDAYNQCWLTLITPHNQGCLNWFVETYNNSYVILSNTHWQMYSNAGVSDVKLIYPADGGYYFQWIQVPAR